MNNAPLAYPVYCINLDSRPDRLQLIRQQFLEQNIPWRRIRAFGSADVQRIQPDIIIGEVTRAEVGCLLSHREAWLQIVKSANPCGVILEDDARLSATFMKLVNEVVAIAPHNWQIIYLDGTQTSGSNGIEPVLDHWRSHGYIIHTDAAEFLLEQTLPIGGPVDYSMVEMQTRGDCYVATRAIVTLLDSNSDIRPQIALTYGGRQRRFVSWQEKNL